ncbi:hypothetical protein [Paraburkholderia hayleyella]|uniref:hypothetical protein n=1 Tax=Paraburkholderia hayleyella TaxID=2152889 RepID=UPI001FE5E49F|nr:hypothetical protein [Paraburkholderia hayleyella]
MRPDLELQRFESWPPGLCALFDGTSLVAKAGFTASLVQSASSGELRTALLGIGELYAPDSRTLCVALWPQSRSAETLRCNGRAALTYVFEGAFYQVQLRFAVLPDVPVDLATATASIVTPDLVTAKPQQIATFTGVIETGEAQRVRYAHLTGGMGFELDTGERDRVLARWAWQIGQLKRRFAAVQR